MRGYLSTLLGLGTVALLANDASAGTIDDHALDLALLARAEGSAREMTHYKNANPGGPRIKFDGTEYTIRTVSNGEVHELVYGDHGSNGIDPKDNITVRKLDSKSNLSTRNGWKQDLVVRDDGLDGVVDYARLPVEGEEPLEISDRSMGFVNSNEAAAYRATAQARADEVVRRIVRSVRPSSYTENLQ